MWHGHISLMMIPLDFFNPVALRRAKTLWSFGPSECNRVKCGRDVCHCHILIDDDTIVE